MPAKLCAQLLTLLAVSISCSPTERADPQRADLLRFLEPLEAIEFAELENGKQDHIAKCMAAEGFDYSPEYMTEKEAEQLRALTTVAYPVLQENSSNQWTYGAADFLRSEERRDGALSSINDGRVATLPPNEQDAYYSTLFGRTEGEDSGAGSGEGCVVEAARAIEGEVSPVLIEQADMVIDQLELRIAASELLVEAEKGWSVCMAHAGFNDLQSPLGIFQMIDELMLSSGFEPEPEIIVTDSINLVPEVSTGPSEVDLLALTQAEMDLANADARCSRANDVRAIYASERTRLMLEILDEYGF